MPPKKKGHNNSRNNHLRQEREPLAEDYGEEGKTEYAKVVKALGDCRFTCSTINGEHVGILSGRVKKRGRICASDVVLVSRRDFETTGRKEKLDILHKYTADMARNLLRWGELDFTKDVGELCIDEAFEFSYDDDAEEEKINLDDI